jgi:hypothetical protein
VLAEEPLCDAERVLAADCDQGVEAAILEILKDLLNAASSVNGLVRLVPMMVPPRGRIPETCCGPRSR